MSSLKILESFRIPTNKQSFLLPFAHSGVPYLRKRSRSPCFRHPLLRGHHDLQVIQNHVAPSYGPPARVLSPLFFQAQSLLLPKPRGKKEHPRAAVPAFTKTTWSAKKPHMADRPGF